MVFIIVVVILNSINESHINKYGTLILPNKYISFTIFPHEDPLNDSMKVS